MAKSYKLKDGNYIDSGSISHNKIRLSNILDYSTEERIVGNWINGKPLYEKVLIGPSVGSSSMGYINLNVDNIDEMLDAYGFGSASNGNWFPLSRAHKDSFSFQISFFYTKTLNRFEIETGSNIVLNKTCVIARYTKTTD